MAPVNIIVMLLCIETRHPVVSRRVNFTLHVACDGTRWKMSTFCTACVYCNHRLSVWSLQKRALKLQQQRLQEDIRLAGEREKELAKDKMLTAVITSPSLSTASPHADPLPVQCTVKPI